MSDWQKIYMDDEDRTPMPVGFNPTQWEKADEVHHKMALVSSDEECVKIVYDALSAQSARFVSVKGLTWGVFTYDGMDCFIAEGMGEIYEVGVDLSGQSYWCRFRVLGSAKFTDCIESAKADAQADYEARIRSALSAQVQDVAGWHDIKTLEPKDGMIVVGWGEYRDRDGFSPAFMRWYSSINSWSVSAMPFFPTHWMPLPTPPKEAE